MSTQAPEMFEVVRVKGRSHQTVCEEFIEVLLQHILCRHYTLSNMINIFIKKTL